MLKAKLLEHNLIFVAMATELLHVIRGTPDRSCSVCGVGSGIQHEKGNVCWDLVEWRYTAQDYRQPTEPLTREEVDAS